MKKQLWLGAVFSLSLLFSASYANSVRETSGTAGIQKAEPTISLPSLETSDPSKSSGPYRVDAAQEVGARWSGLNRQNNSEVMAFTSTFAANNAAKLLGGDSGSLSFANFGRVPFYQVLALTNDINSTSLNKATSRPSASLPEPTTLALLGAGLAALAAGLRKKNKDVQK
ncbi:MAG: PEP-CTERM sorting domain-containing protein [Blastocatellia bacterium]|nr:PEP-CTERM sorting domain-containing protein [Blastocatellia bacterium]